jgi:hypothetical protein
MAHCPPELLDDLADLFAELRQWPGVAEKSRGVFYVRRVPFLHFHRAPDGRRRADIKAGGRWVPFDLPRPISAARVLAFRRALRRYHADRMAPALSTRAARRSSERTAE